MMGIFGPSFSSAKCKTALRLCVGRIKLLKNKKAAALKALRKGIADLLSGDKADSARIRVEAVLREEAMIEVMEVLDLFCELLVVRLPLIESSKELPADLKEAISSVIYAAKRATELPELTHARAQFAGKYGKEYIQACSEAQTAHACGVNPVIIDKLAIKAPSAEEAFAKLKAIADEHGVDFDVGAASQTVLGNPHRDLLDGPAPQPAGADVGGKPVYGGNDPAAQLAQQLGGGATHFVDASQAAAHAAYSADQARAAAAAAAQLAGQGARPMAAVTPLPNAPLPPQNFLVDAFPTTAVAEGEVTPPGAKISDIGAGANAGGQPADASQAVVGDQVQGAGGAPAERPVGGGAAEGPTTPASYPQGAATAADPHPPSPGNAGGPAPPPGIGGVSPGIGGPPPGVPGGPPLPQGSHPGDTLPTVAGVASPAVNAAAEMYIGSVADDGDREDDAGLGGEGAKATNADDGDGSGDSFDDLTKRFEALKKR